MYKATALVLLGLIASASTSESTVKMQLYKTALSSTASSVSWSECESQRLYDVACGTASPNPPNVGDFVGLNLDVIFNTDVNVVANMVSVKFTALGSTNPINLYTQDFPSGAPGDYGAGDEYTDSLTWFIPSFAPLGHYHAQIQVHGTDPVNDVFACLVADFDITS